MRSLKSVLFLALAAPLALAACSSSPAETTTESSSTTANQAMATAQQALRTAQQAEADVKASNQQSSEAYQRSLAK